MQTPFLGCAYSFSFRDKFSKYDGIYTVSRILTFDETLLDQIDLSALYVDAGYTAEDYNTEVDTIDSSKYPRVPIREDKILKLQSVSDETVTRYIPFTICSTTPNPNIKQYHKLVLSLDLGTYDNMEDIDYITNVIQDTASKALGVSSTVDMFSYATVWMTEDAYADIQSERDTKKTEIINLFSENNRLRTELDKAKTLITKYETTIINLSK